MTTLLDDLCRLGFTSNQARVYLALFKAREAKAGDLIRRTGLHRNIVYVALAELNEKKLISQSKRRGVTVFKALSSGRLVAGINEQKLVAKRAIEELKLLSKPGNSQEITVFEGPEEFRQHVHDSFVAIPPGGIVRYLGVSPKWHEIVGPSLKASILKAQRRKKIQMRALAQSLSAEDQLFVEQSKGLAKVRLNPLISSDTSGIEIQEQKISIRSFIEPYFVVEIVHPQLAENYRNYFDFLWSQKF